MSGRVLRFEGSVHTEAERLLPWLVNGTLQNEELALVQQHLGECMACQHELAWLRSLQAICIEETLPADNPGRSLRRLRRRLDSARVGTRHDRVRRQPWLGWVIAAEAVLLLVLGAALLHETRSPAPAYHTLAAAQVPSEKLVVVFDPGISEAQLRRLMRASEAHIVYGPTEAGAWVISVPAAHAKTTREALRAAPGVMMVENLTAGDGY